MADFPAKVSTETSVPNSQTAARHVMSVSMDLNFIKTFPGLLLLLEIVVGLLVWALIASTPHQLYAAFGWVLFVSVTLWILTIVIFILLFMGLQQKFPSVPWPLVLMVFYAVAAILYVTAFLATAITAAQHRIFLIGYNEMAAASFFAIVVTLMYAGSTVLAYVQWRSDDGNAAASTVPV